MGEATAFPSSSKTIRSPFYCEFAVQREPGVSGRQLRFSAHAEHLAAAWIVKTSPKISTSGLAWNVLHFDAATWASRCCEITGNSEIKQVFLFLFRKAFNHHQQHFTIDQRNAVALGNLLRIIRKSTACHEKRFADFFMCHYTKKLSNRLYADKTLAPCLALDD